MSSRAATRLLGTLIVSVMCLFQQIACAQTTNDTSASNSDFQFEVASIKLNKNPPYGPGTGGLLPDGIRAIGANTYSTLMLAYRPKGTADVKNMSIIHAPDWVISERYDIEARISEKDLKEWGSQSGPPYDRVLFRAAIRNLLKERYKLQAHLVNTQVPYLNIVVNQHHKKLVAVPEIPPRPEDARKLPSGGYMTMDRDQDNNITWKFSGCTMNDLASFLASNFPQPVQDKTGLTGRYNFQFTANTHDMVEDIRSSMNGLGGLGLHLRDEKGPGYNLVIDHIERPDAN
jgi:uncharacterized protein (TIGR03435 family)